MNEVDSRLGEAEKYFAEKKYDAAANLCLELINEKKCLGYANMLFAKALLFMIPNILADEYDNSISTFRKAAVNAIDYAETLEDGYNIDYQLRCAWYQWSIQGRKIDCLQLAQNMNDVSYKAYLLAGLSYVQERTVLEAALKQCRSVSENWAKLLNGAGLTLEEAEEKYCKDTPKNSDSEREIRAMLGDVAWHAFERIVDVIEKNGKGSTDLVSTLFKTLSDRLYVPRLVLDFICNEEDDAQLRKKWLLQKATMIEFELNAVVYPNGVPMSLMQSGRNELIQNLLDTYKKIQVIDPSFVMPALPNASPITPPQGCYVATAVYGSYDCPQVWTLRRYRDYTLAETWYGRAFIHTYYAISPTLVKWFGHTEWFKKMWKGKLDRMVEKLQNDGVESTPYQDRTW